MMIKIVCKIKNENGVTYSNCIVNVSRKTLLLPEEEKRVKILFAIFQKMDLEGLFDYSTKVEDIRIYG